VSLSRLLISLAVLFCLAAPVAAQPGLTVGDTVEGELLAGAGTSAAYRFTARARDILRFELTSTLPDAQLELYNAQGFLINIGYGDGQNGASLVFIVYADGDYTIKVVNYGQGGGSYRLSFAQEAVQPLVPNQPVTVEMRARPLYFMFEGRRDQLFTLSASSGGQMDTRLDVLNPTGSQVAYAYSEVDPVLPRLLVREDGPHTVLLYPPSDDLSGPVTVLLRQIEPLSLDAGPQTITLNRELQTEVLSMNVAPGIRYRMTVTVLGGVGVDLAVFMFQGDRLIARLNATADAMQTAALDFAPRSTGKTVITIRDYAVRDGETRLLIAVEPLPGGN